MSSCLRKSEEGSDRDRIRLKTHTHTHTHNKLQIGSSILIFQRLKGQLTGQGGGIWPRTKAESWGIAWANSTTHLKVHSSKTSLCQLELLSDTSVKIYLKCLTLRSLSFIESRLCFFKTLPPFGYEREI